jgi:hypothetical protein
MFEEKETNIIIVILGMIGLQIEKSFLVTIKEYIRNTLKGRSKINIFIDGGCSGRDSIVIILTISNLGSNWCKLLFRFNKISSN